MVLFRIGGGATPLPSQPNPTYYGSSTTTTTKETTPTSTPSKGVYPPPQTYPHPTPYIPPQPKEGTLGNNTYTFTVSTTTTPTTTPPTTTLISVPPSSSGGSTTTTPPTSTPSTGLSTLIGQAVAALNSPPPMPTTPPTVPIIPALGPNFVGWRPWELIQQWGTSAELQWLLDQLRQQAEIRNAILEQMAKEGLPVTPVPVITEEETKRPIGLRAHYIPM